MALLRQGGPPVGLRSDPSVSCLPRGWSRPRISNYTKGLVCRSLGYDRVPYRTVTSHNLVTHNVTILTVTTPPHLDPQRPRCDHAAARHRHPHRVRSGFDSVITQLLPSAGLGPLVPHRPRPSRPSDLPTRQDLSRSHFISQIHALCHTLCALTNNFC